MLLVLPQVPPIVTAIPHASLADGAGFFGWIFDIAAAVEAPKVGASYN